MEQLDNTRFNSHLVDNRQIRIFLSSTFSDMQEERTAIIQTFEMLKLEAAKRDVSLSVVDLRWGVTDEDAKTGKVISVCLNEIENSHPFFIGILGSNYGTAPELSELEKNPDLKERYEWIEKAISDDGMSITEMEIRYGVLHNNDEIDAVFFFKKSNQPDNNKRLTELKKEIRKKYDPEHRNDYTTPSQLCKKLVKEVRKIIDKHFPKEDVVTLLDKERTAQRAYINSRHSYYFERQSYYDKIDSFINSNEQYLVITGESGIGKSALLANWIKRVEKNPDYHLAYHFVENSFSGNSLENILRHICDEIYDLYSIKRIEGLTEIEDAAKRLVDLLSTKEKSIVIVIDGINYIVDKKTDVKLLLWLPVANRNVKFIISTVPEDDTMKTIKRRGYKCISIKSLSDDERREWIPYYLKRVGKQIEEKRNDDKPSQLERIVKNEKCENTLVLRSFIDELTCFGIHEKLDERIDYYLSATSITDFFDRVLQRMENDYGAELVRHSLSLISISEFGMPEDELIKILGWKYKPLDWKLFFCAFYNNFVIIGGLITITQHYLIDAIEKRYNINNIQATKKYRQEIVRCISNVGRENKSYYRLRSSELAYQYYYLSDWNRLYKTLLNYDVFELLYDRCVLLSKYWKSIRYNSKGKYSILDFLKVKGDNIDDERRANLLNKMANLVSLFMDDYTSALVLYDSSMSIKKQLFGECHSDVAMLYDNISSCYLRLVNSSKWINSIKENKAPQTSIADNEFYYKSLVFAKRALAIRVDLYGWEHSDVGISLSNIAALYEQWGLFVDALDLYESALSIELKKLGVNHPYTASSFNNVGLANWNILKAGLSNEDVADVAKRTLFYLRMALKIRIIVFGDYHYETTNSYHNIGTVYAECMQYTDALFYFQKALDIRERLFGPDHYHTLNTRLWLEDVKQKCKTV